MEASSNALLETSKRFGLEMEAMSATLEHLRKINSGSSLTEEWHEDLLHRLAAEVGANANRILLLIPQGKDNLSTLAYLVRNLLELNVWIGYCRMSKSNARRFYEDRWKDGVGLQRALENLVGALPAVPNLSEIQSAMAGFEKTLQQTAATAGISSLDDDYTRVAKAADELGYRAFFVALNTFLSKFAHPTAMMVLASLQDEPSAQLFAFFLAFGVGLAVSGWKDLTEYVKSIESRTQQ